MLKPLHSKGLLTNRKFVRKKKENLLDVKISFYRLVAIFGGSEERERGLYLLGSDLVVTALTKYH